MNTDMADSSDGGSQWRGNEGFNLISICSDTYVKTFTPTAHQLINETVNPDLSGVHDRFRKTVCFVLHFDLLFFCACGSVQAEHQYWLQQQKKGSEP